MEMERPIRVLMLEDSENDAAINMHALRSGSIETECRRVSTREAFEGALESFAPDIVLLDYWLPEFDGRSALKIVREKHCETPAIIVTGTLGDESAVELLKAGAADYVLKDRIARLASAVKKALDEEYRRRERIATHRELETKIVLLETQQESLPDGIFVVDVSGRVIARNRRFCEICRIPEELREGTDDREIWKCAAATVNHPEAFLSRIAYLSAHLSEKSREEVETTDGRILDRYSSPIVDSHGMCLGRIWIFRDITKERESERRLKLFRTLIDNSNDEVFVVDAGTLSVLDVNERACLDLRYTREQLLTMRVPDIAVNTDEKRIQRIHDELRATGKIVFEAEFRRSDGSCYPNEVSVSLVQADRPYYLAIVRDITERKRAQQALEESELRYRMLIEDSSDPVTILEKDGTVRYISAATTGTSGFTPQEIMGRKIWEFIHPDDIEALTGNFRQVLETSGEIVRMNLRLRRKDNTWYTVEGSLRNRLDFPPINGLIAAIHDVTERERLGRALSAMTAVDAAIVRAVDEQALAQRICDITVEIGLYRGAWIGYPEQDEAKSIKVVAAAGDFDHYLEIARLSWAGTHEGVGPTGAAIQAGRVQVNRQYAESLARPEQRIEALRHRYMACIALPFTGHQGVFGAVTLYANDPLAFDDAEVTLLEQLAADVSYGIEALRDRRQHALDLERMERNMEATVQALAAMVETRDPYTAGHERRVAMLSVAIAEELGLSPERVKALNLAAMIHDVGKIKTPAEILVKPGELSAIEFALVKSHPQAGYEILRNIDFPWPIAEMVQQHHEKLDGSGYPNGLVGDQILLESRILAVADVVEAMSSHRPYRPGRGIDAALEEIAQRRGTKFDPAVVDACIRLFREKGFALG